MSRMLLMGVGDEIHGTPPPPSGGPWLSLGFTLMDNACWIMGLISLLGVLGG